MSPKATHSTRSRAKRDGASSREKSDDISAALFQTILNNIPDQAWLKDTEGRYLAVNRTYVGACGIPRDRIIGRTAAEIWPPDIAAQYQRTDRRVILAGKQAHYEERRVVRSGRTAIFETIKAPVWDQEGSIIGTAGISRDITHFKTIQEELLEQRKRSNRLWVHLQSIRDEERVRISREIHDELSQNLSALRLGLDWLETSPVVEKALLFDKIRQLKAITNATIQQMAKIALELRPAILIDLGLRAAIQHIVTTTIEHSAKRLEIEFSFHAEENAFDPEMKLTFFRVVQEALTNIRKHAEAQIVRIRLYETKRELVLTVKDDGCGLKKANGPTGRAGLGILGMEERAKLLNGRLTVNSGAKTGTRLCLRIPKKSIRNEQR